MPRSDPRSAKTRKSAKQRERELPQGVKLRATLREESLIGKIAWSPNGQIIACPCESGAINLWDVETGRVTGRLEHGLEPVHRVAWSADGHWLASVGSTKMRKDVGEAKEAEDLGGVKIWDIKKGRVLQPPSVPAAKPRNSPSIGLSLAFAWSPTEPVLAVAFPETISLLKDNRVTHQFKVGGAISSLCWTQDGDSIALISSDKGLILLDITGDHAIQRTRKGAPRYTHDSAFAAGEFGTFLAVGENNAITVFDLSTENAIWHLEGPHLKH